MIFKGEGSLDTVFFFKVIVETCNNQESSHVKVPYRTNQIQRELPRNTFFKVMVENQVVLGFSHVWVAYGTNKRQ